ncbi:MAG: response regulator [Lachnospiraceae bacterium]|jgi:two-component system response regulator YesN|nr:response regulator [Lachnospiraceae bacterium]MCI1329292.1 response regulator [Lachnospiraceae bacterium]
MGKKSRVLIVDDDTMVRIGLKTVMDWEKNGYEVIGEASDGEGALRLADRFYPDIIITDIKMPVMDGLTLIENLNRLHNPARVVVLSSYDEFDLVKRAMKLGARDYILKLNLDPAELLNCLESLKTDQPDEDNDADHRIWNDAQTKKVLQQNFLQNVISDFYIGKEEFFRQMRELDLDLYARPVYSVILKNDEVYRFEGAPADKVQLLQFSVINITEEIIGECHSACCFPLSATEFVVIFTGSGEKELSEIVKLGRRLCVMLNEYLSVQFSVFIGESKKEGREGIQEAYRRSYSAMMNRFHMEKDGILVWTEGMKKAGRDAYNVEEIREELHDILITGSREDLNRFFDKLTEDMKRISISRSTAHNIAFELLHVVQEYCAQNEISPRSVLKNSFRSYEEVLQMSTLREIMDWTGCFRGDLDEYREKIGDKGIPQVIHTVTNWIAEHYAETASLQEAAEFVHLSPSYLSSVLKKHTGKSYNELLTDYRINRARDLLLRTSEKVYQIGVMVGYPDKYYFNRIFKRVTGMSPGEFKNQKRGG